MLTSLKKTKTKENKKPNYVLISKAGEMEAFKNKFMFLNYFEKIFPLCPVIKIKMEFVCCPQQEVSISVITVIYIYRPCHF